MGSRQTARCQESTHAAGKKFVCFVKLYFLRSCYARPNYVVSAVALFKIIRNSPKKQFLTCGPVVLRVKSFSPQPTLPVREDAPVRMESPDRLRGGRRSGEDTVDSVQEYGGR